MATLHVNYKRFLRKKMYNNSDRHRIEEDNHHACSQSQQLAAATWKLGLRIARSPTLIGTREEEVIDPLSSVAAVESRD